MPVVTAPASAILVAMSFAFTAVLIPASCVSRLAVASPSHVLASASTSAANVAASIALFAILVAVITSALIVPTVTGLVTLLTDPVILPVIAVMLVGVAKPA